jgi:hypothetical protein
MDGVPTLNYDGMEARALRNVDLARREKRSAGSQMR